MHMTLLSTGTVEPYAGVLAVMVVAVLLAGSIIVLSHLIGPKKAHGPIKDEAYESGMPPITDARRRFRVRFYIVAVLFLLFDVEVLLLWPWAPVFTKTCETNESFRLATGVMASEVMAGKGFLLASMGLFVLLLIVGLVYEWRRGVFRWD